MLFEGLYSIYIRSILNSIYPDNWKIAKVLAAFKKRVKSDLANYRPLSMLNLNSKVLESIVSDSTSVKLVLYIHTSGGLKKANQQRPCYFT